MDVHCDIIKINPLADDSLNFNHIIFRICLKKGVDGSNINYIIHFINTLINGGALKIIVDMKEMEYIDSSGIGAFIKTAKIIRANKGEIAFLDVPSQIKDIFKIVKLQNFIKILHSETEVLNFFSFLIE
ncbi:STAS domain-containing protein [Spirochaetota bacterium]